MIFFGFRVDFFFFFGRIFCPALRVVFLWFLVGVFMVFVFFYYFWFLLLFLRILFVCVSLVNLIVFGIFIDPGWGVYCFFLVFFVGFFSFCFLVVGAGVFFWGLGCILFSLFGVGVGLLLFWLCGGIDLGSFLGRGFRVIILGSPEAGRWQYTFLCVELI